MQEVLAILVLYNCRLNTSETFLSLDRALQYSSVKLDMLVYDNSPVAQYNIDHFVEGNVNIQYISDISNPGVSKAYNVGAILARKQKKKWILLLDQDTIFPNNYICILNNSLNFEPDLIVPSLWNNRNALLSPCKFVLGRAVGLKKIKPGFNSIKYRNFLNSGSCISLVTFNQVKGFDEKIPLYYSDFDFFSRLSCNVDVFYLLDAKCRHDMASSDYSDVDKFEFRFVVYCQGALAMGKTIHLKIVMALYTILRGVKVFLKTKDKRFLIFPIKIIYENLFHRCP